jgi:hypothetical protein
MSEDKAPQLVGEFWNLHSPSGAFRNEARMRNHKKEFRTSVCVCVCAVGLSNLAAIVSVKDCAID